MGWGRGAKGEEDDGKIRLYRKPGDGVQTGTL